MYESLHEAKKQYRPWWLVLFFKKERKKKDRKKERQHPKHSLEMLVKNFVSVGTEIWIYEAKQWKLLLLTPRCWSGVVLKMHTDPPKPYLHHCDPVSEHDEDDPWMSRRWLLFTLLMCPNGVTVFMSCRTSEISNSRPGGPQCQTFFSQSPANLGLGKSLLFKKNNNNSTCRWRSSKASWSRDNTEDSQAYILVCRGLRLCTAVTGQWYFSYKMADIDYI